MYKQTRIRGQSSIEYLTTYGVAMLIVALSISVLFLVFTQPTFIAPNSCNFVDGMICEEVVIAPAAASSNAIVTLFLKSELQYSLYDPTAYVQINNINSSKTSCMPTFVSGSGSILCIITTPEQTYNNQYLSGSIYLSAHYCGLITGNEVCSALSNQIYVGSFQAHTQPKSSIPIALSISPLNPTFLSDGQKYLITAKIELNGYSLPSLPINFTESPNSYDLSPGLSQTDQEGQAYAYISSNSSGSTAVAADFGTYQATSVVSFNPATTLYSTVSGFNGCGSESASILDIAGLAYSCNQLNGNYIYFNPGSYSYDVAVPDYASGPNIRQNFTNMTFDGVKIISTSGTFTIIKNSKLNMGYVQQYGVLQSASPSSAQGGFSITNYLSNGDYMTVTNPSSSEMWVNSSTKAMVCATPAAGYTFSSWSCSGTGCYSGPSVGAGGGESYCTANIIVGSPIEENAIYT